MAQQQAAHKAAYVASQAALINLARQIDAVVQPVAAVQQQQGAAVQQQVAAEGQFGGVQNVEDDQNQLLVQVAVPRTRLLARAARIVRSFGRNVWRTAALLLNLVTTKLGKKRKDATIEDTLDDTITKFFLNDEKYPSHPGSIVSSPTNSLASPLSAGGVGFAFGQNGGGDMNIDMEEAVAGEQMPQLVEVAEMAVHNPHLHAVADEVMVQEQIPNPFNNDSLAHLATLNQIAAREIANRAAQIREEKNASDGISERDAIRMKSYLDTNDQLTITQIEEMMDGLSKSGRFCGDAVYEVLYAAFVKKSAQSGHRMLGGFRIVTMHVNPAAMALQNRRGGAGAVGDGNEFANLGMRHMVVFCIFSEKIETPQQYVGGLLRRIKEHTNENVTYVILVDGSLLKEYFESIQTASAGSSYPIMIVAVSFSCKQSKRDGYEHAHKELMMSTTRILPLLSAGFLTATSQDTDDNGVIQNDQIFVSKLRQMREKGDDFHNLSGIYVNFCKPSNVESSLYYFNRSDMLPSGKSIQVSMGRWISFGRPIPHHVIDHAMRHSCLCNQGKKCPIDGCMARFSIEQIDIVSEGEKIEGEFGTTRINQSRKTFQYGSDEKMTEFLCRRSISLGYSIIIVILGQNSESDVVIEHYGNIEHKEQELNIVRRALSDQM
jgi:hypothetical protein